MFIYPYKAGSKSAKALSEELGARRIKREGSRFVGNANKTVINWGNSELPAEIMNCNVINKPDIVAMASNKLKFFQAIKAHNRQLDYEREDQYVNIPEFTDNRNVAWEWVRFGSYDVVARTLLQGNSGAGIIMVPKVARGSNELEEPEQVVQAPLYVRYIPKKSEFRVHVANGQVVDLQRKARRHDVPDDEINWKIRNHDNGFIFARNDIEAPPKVELYAVNACKAIGLDFGAVDVIYNEHQQQAYVLEINTAPGLTGTTLDGYVERFGNWE